MKSRKTLQAVVKMLPRWIYFPLRRAYFLASLACNSSCDFRRFVKWSGGGGCLDSRVKLRAAITAEYHQIEKGLALAEPRPGFGREVVERLLSRLRVYRETYGVDRTLRLALSTLLGYQAFNEDHGLNDPILDQQLSALQDGIPGDCESIECDGAVIALTANAILDSANRDLQAFFASRHSIRQFVRRDVDLGSIKQAVIMAQTTPSVCNRQSCKVHVLRTDEDKRKALGLQTGNRGFGKDASIILVVTSELGHFLYASERNQCWIDGGMFAMSLGCKRRNFWQVLLNCGEINSLTIWNTTIRRSNVSNVC